MNTETKSQLATVKKNINCSICLEDIEKDIEFLPCIHGFHKECVDGWIKEKPECPICKVPVYVNTPEQLDMYNYYKDRRERLAQEEARFFHQVSAGAFDNNNNINNTTRQTNYVDSILNNITIPTNGRIRNMSNLISIFEILINNNFPENQQPELVAIPINDSNDTHHIEVNTESNENEEPRVIIPAGVLRDIIQDGVLREIIHSGIPPSNSDDDDSSDF